MYQLKSVPLAAGLTGIAGAAKGVQGIAGVAGRAARTAETGARTAQAAQTAIARARSGDLMGAVQAGKVAKAGLDSTRSQRKQIQRKKIIF